MLIKTTFLVLILYFHVDVGNCGCEDDESLIFRLNGQNLTCAEYISQIPCDCRKTLTNNLNEQVKVKKACCASCKGKNLKECNCQNILSDEQPLPFNGYSIKSCEELANDFPELCKEKTIGKKMGACCKACKDVSLKCIDTRVRKFQIGDNEFDCPGLIGKDKCFCIEFGKDCCESCKEEDVSDCCINDEKFKVSAKLKGKNGKRCKNCNCEELVSADPTGVLMDSVCVKNSRNARRRCCKSCKAVKSKFEPYG